MLMLLSVIPWSRLTNNTLKDFNLFGDLFPSEGSAAINTTSSIVDPELEAMMTQADGGGGTASDATPATAVADSTETDTCTLQDIETIEAPVIDGLTPDQRFYLAYANVWAANITKDEIMQRTTNDPHSLGRWRVNATLRNIQPFYEAFGIEEGDPMFMPEAERVIIW